MCVCACGVFFWGGGDKRRDHALGQATNTAPQMQPFREDVLLDSAYSAEDNRPVTALNCNNTCDTLSGHTRETVQYSRQFSQSETGDGGGSVKTKIILVRNGRGGGIPQDPKFFKSKTRWGSLKTQNFLSPKPGVEGWGWGV